MLRTAALALVLLTASCGGSGDPAIEVPESVATDDAGDEPPEAGTDPSLTRLAGAWAESSAKVTYDLTSGTAPAQTMTLYWLPPDSWRMDIGGDAGSTIIISTPDAGYVCTVVTGASTCVESPGDPSTQAPIPFAGLFSSPEGLLEEIETQTGGGTLEKSREQIAGLGAQCFAASADAATGSGAMQWCFSADGILVRYSVAGASTAGAGQFSMEATEVDREVGPADFEPPYPLAELPTPDS